MQSFIRNFTCINLLYIMNLTFFPYSFVCLICCFFFLKDIEDNKFLNLKGQTLLFIFLILFYVMLWIFSSPLILLFLSSLFPLSFFVLVPYLEKKERDKTILLLSSLISPLKMQMKLGVFFMEAWDQAVKELDESFAKDFILKISDTLRFQKHFWHSSPELRLFVHQLMEIRRSPQSLDRLSEFQNKLKTEEDFQRKTSKALLQLRWQSFILTGVYFCVFGFTLSAYHWTYPKLMLSSLCCFLMGLYWLSKIGGQMKWRL